MVLRILSLNLSLGSKLRVELPLDLNFATGSSNLSLNLSFR